MIKYDKVFGERHTGTNAVRIFLKKNWDLESHDYGFLGWKHRLAPSMSEVEKFDINHTLFVFTIRSPYTWIQAMHRQPYYWHCPESKDRPLEEFITFQIEDYENSIAMWNKKNRSYLELSKKLSNSMLVKIEDFRNYPLIIAEKVNLLLGVNRTDTEEVKRVDTYFSGVRERNLQNPDIDEQLRMKYLKPSTLEIINKHLDFQLMNELGYNIEE